MKFARRRLTPPSQSFNFSARRLPRGAVAFAVLLSVAAVDAVDSSSPATSATSPATPLSYRPMAASRAVVGPAPVCRAVTSSTTKKTTMSCVNWASRDTWTGRPPVIEVINFVPRGQSSVVAYAGWIRTAATVLGLYLGYEGPGVTNHARGPEKVPPTGLSRLLATFNSGFYEKDGAAGFYTNHTLYFPMVKGLATIVRYTNGTVGITRWAGGPNPGPTVLMARQNLTLLVNHSAAAPATSDNRAWGVTLHGVPAVWRSSLGVDGNGNLVYAAAPDQTAASMASIMVQLHCVRAMELDINPEWPIFVTYAGPGAVGPALDVANPNQVPGRFLYTSTKDFFGVFLSRGSGGAQPW